MRHGLPGDCRQLRYAQLITVLQLINTHRKLCVFCPYQEAKEGILRRVDFANINTEQQKAVGST
jgi:hypothetical protein